MDRELADFVVFCRVERRLADATCRAYERDVRACLQFLAERGVRELGAVRAPDLRAFLATEAEHHPARSSQARAVAALTGFFRFCVESEYLERDPALVCARRKSARRCPTCLISVSWGGCWRCPTAARCGSGGSRAGVSAIGCSWRCSRTRCRAAQSCSASTGMFASELLVAGANLRQIQEPLGQYKHLDSTQRYTRVTAHQLRGAVKRLRFG
jgi:site-specific recombinase XerD